MVILGIDPGTATTGFGAVRFSGTRCRALGFGSIDTDSGTPPAERLLAIHKRMHELLEAYQPDALAIERLFFNKNVSTALAVGQARGVAMLAAAEHSIPVHEYTPSAVKVAVTGGGNATKQQVGYMVKVVLALEAVPRPDDVADALAVAICHGHTGQTKARWDALGAKGGYQ